MASLETDGALDDDSISELESLGRVMGAEGEGEVEESGDTMDAASIAGTCVATYAGGEANRVVGAGTTGSADTEPGVTVADLKAAIRGGDPGTGGGKPAGGSAFCTSEALWSIESVVRPLLSIKSPTSSLFSLIASLYFVRFIGSRSREGRGGVPAEVLTT